jgi:hypothetical protein
MCFRTLASRTALQIQDEEVGCSIIFRPLFDEKSGTPLIEGLKKDQEHQWQSPLVGPIPRPDETQVDFCHSPTVECL